MASCKGWAAEKANGELKGWAAEKNEWRAARVKQLKKLMASCKGWAAEKANCQLQEHYHRSAEGSLGVAGVLVGFPHTYLTHEVP